MTVVPLTPRRQLTILLESLFPSVAADPSALRTTEATCQYCTHMVVMIYIQLHILGPPTFLRS